MLQAKVLPISEVAKTLLLEKMLNQSIVVLVDSQAAIKALIKCTLTSITVLNCIRNLNQFRRSPIAENKKGFRKFSVRRFLAFSTKISTVQKIVLFSSQGKGIFRGFKAKAKDLTFAAKSKDFKTCPRGRPRGQGLIL